jgi:hypothetical protein
MKNSTMNRCSPVVVQTSTVKKSAATIRSQLLCQKFFPCALATSLRRGFHAVPFQNVSDGAASEFVSRIRQCALDSTMPPRPALSRHLDDQLLDLGSRAGTPGPAFSALVVFLSDQTPVPAQQCLRRHDRRDLGQKRSPESFGFRCQPSSLAIREPQTPLAELFAKYTVLFAQIFNYLKLALIHPAGNSDQQEPKWIENSRHLVASLSTDRTPGSAAPFSTRSDFQAIRPLGNR